MNISISDKQLYWFIIVLPIVMILFGLTLYLMFSAQKSNQGVFDGVYERVIEARLLYSPSCLAYEDSNGRVYTGLVDLKKINDPTFQRCIPVESSTDVAVRIYITYEQNGQKTAYSLSTSNWNSKTNQRKTTGATYPINVYGAGPGSIKFIYRY